MTEAITGISDYLNSIFWREIDRTAYTAMKVRERANTRRPNAFRYIRLDEFQWLSVLVMEVQRITDIQSDM